MDLLSALQPAILPLVLGVMIGVVMALTGAGGGILSVPLLVFALNLPLINAGPIGLLAVAVSSAFGALLALRAGTLRYRAALLLALAGLIFSPFGLWLAHQIPNQPLTIIFAVVLLYVAIKILLEVYRNSKGIQEPHQFVPCTLDLSIGRLIWTVPCARALMGSGALAGFLSGLLGVGGGFVIVPALKKISNLPMQSIVATSLGVIALISLGGVAGSSLSGNMNWSIAVPFACGAILGMLIGRIGASRISNQSIQLVFGMFLVLVAIGLVIKSV